RGDVALLDELDVAPRFDDLAGDLVAEDQSCGGGSPPADHVLVGAADVGGDDLEQHAVLDFFLACRVVELGEVDGLDLHFAGLDVGDATIGRRHDGPPRRSPWNGRRDYARGWRWDAMKSSPAK